MATSPANPAEIQDRTKKDDGKRTPASDRDEPGEKGGGRRGDDSRQAQDTGNK